MVVPSCQPTDGELFPTICHPKKRAYLIAFAETGNKVQAAKAAGVSHATVYSPPWKADEAFQAGLVVAQERHPRKKRPR